VPTDYAAERRAAAGGGDRDFIRTIIDEDLETGRHDGRVVTRFPPEPNGYLHIGHAKSIVLNFGLAEEYADRADTTCRLRFDDTNPHAESEEYARAIEEAVRWLGYAPDEVRHASDYFEQFYEYANVLIRKDKAYVDSQSDEEIRANRGTVTEPGTPSPYRDRSVEENMDLFERMKAGEFADGEHVLRAKIDMASPHMIMRDPLLFRIRHAEHYRRGDEWCIYPMYDFAHCLEDAIEDVTHSLCTLEFDNNRRVYDWVLDHCLPDEEQPQRPYQFEFNRLNLGYTVMSKRKLRQLVEDDVVSGWDDPRLPTLAGLRRRGVPPSAIRRFCRDVGISRTQGRVEISHFEHAIRDDLNYKAPRVMAVLDPLEVTVTNWPDGETERLEMPNFPPEERDALRDELNDNERAEKLLGSREVPFSRTLFIERDDFRKDPPEGYYRLAPGREVRLRYGYFFTCEEVVTDDNGDVTEIRGTIDRDTRGGEAPAGGRSPRGTIHWVSAEHALPVEARLYDRLFEHPAPDAGDEDFAEHLNPDSLVTRRGFVEPSVASDPPQQRYQFERQGYFWQDPDDARDREPLAFNRIIPLRDPWAEREQAARREAQKKRRREKERRKARQREQAKAAERDPTAGFDEEQQARFHRYRHELELDAGDAATLAESAELASFFETAGTSSGAPQAAANWVVNELLRELKDTALADLPFDAKDVGRLAALDDRDEVSSRAAKKIFSEMLATGADPDQIVEKRNLRQVSDAERLRPVAREVVEAHPDEAARYRDGKEGLIGFFMGQLMQETRGKADPEPARVLLREELAASPEQETD
jgi:glutaminyl-tRNA synthetase